MKTFTASVASAAFMMTQANAEAFKFAQTSNENAVDIDPLVSKMAEYREWSDFADEGTTDNCYLYEVLACTPLLEEEIAYQLENEMKATFSDWFYTYFIDDDYYYVQDSLVEILAELVRENGYFESEELAYKQSVAGEFDAALTRMINDYAPIIEPQPPVVEPPIVEPPVVEPPTVDTEAFLMQSVTNGMDQEVEGQTLKNFVLRHVIQEISEMDHEALSSLVGSDAANSEYIYEKLEWMLLEMTNEDLMPAYEKFAALIGATLEHYKKYDDLDPEMIDAEGMLIWSIIAEHIEDKRLSGDTITAAEFMEFISKHASFIRWDEYEAW